MPFGELHVGKIVIRSVDQNLICRYWRWIFKNFRRPFYDRVININASDLWSRFWQYFLEAKEQFESRSKAWLVWGEAVLFGSKMQNLRDTVESAQYCDPRDLFLRTDPEYKYQKNFCKNHHLLNHLNRCRGLLFHSLLDRKL